MSQGGFRLHLAPGKIACIAALLLAIGEWWPLAHWVMAVLATLVAVFSLVFD
jgi:hypothetical protein